MFEYTLNKNPMMITFWIDNKKMLFPSFIFSFFYIKLHGWIWFIRDRLLHLPFPLKWMEKCNHFYGVVRCTEADTNTSTHFICSLFVCWSIRCYETKGDYDHVVRSNVWLYHSTLNIDLHPRPSASIYIYKNINNNINNTENRRRRRTKYHI